MSTINIAELSPEQITEIEKQIRERKTAAKRSQKHAAFQPHYSEYRKAVTVAKEANDTKKQLLASLKSLGFGKKVSNPAKTTRKKK
jgi:2'-5' RNA ligase